MSSTNPAPYSVQWYRQVLRMAATVAQNDSDDDGFPDGSLSGGAGLDLYSPAKSYKKDDIVIYNDDLYQANEDLPAGTAFVVGVSGFTWREISSSVLVVKEFQAGSPYGVGSLVLRNDVLIRAKVEIAGGPFSASQWDHVKVQNALTMVVEGYNQDNTYNSNQLITRNNKLLLAKEDNVTGTFDDSKWTEMEAKFTIKLREYAGNVSYEEDELVLFEKRMYKAKEAVVNGGTFDSSKWEIVGGGGGIPAYSSSSSYLTGELVTHLEKIWRANEDGITGAWNAGKWTEIAGRSRLRGDFVTGSNIRYLAGDVVYYNGQLWQANTNISEPTDFNVGISGATWRTLSRQGAITPFFSDTYYVEGDYVIYDRKIWSAKTSKEHGGWNKDDWTFAEDVDIILNNYDPNKDYFEGNLIRSGNRILRCKLDITAKAFDSDDWDEVTGVMQGEYDKTRGYAKDAIVTKNNRFYKANTDIPKDTNFAEGTSSNEWTEISPPANPSAPDWADGTYYNRDDLVVNEGTLFRCKTAHEADGSFDSEKFTSLKAEAAAVVAEFEIGANYVKEQLIVTAGTLWRARKEIDTATADDGPEGANSATNWQAVSLTLITLNDHSDQSTYRKDEIAVHNNKIYRANANIDTAKAFDEGDWTAISEETLIVQEFSDSKDYIKDQIVYRNDQLFIAKDAIIAGAWDEEEWLSVNPRNPWQGAYSSSGLYEVGDMVLQDQSLWECNTQITSGEVFDTNKWNRINELMAPRPWTNGMLINKGDMIINDKKLYVADKRFSATSNFTSTDLTLVGDFQVKIDDYSDSATYIMGDLVFHDGSIYRSQENIFTAEAFNSTRWKKIGTVKFKVPDHDQTESYETGEQVIFDNKMYVALNDVAQNTSFDANDGNWLLISSDAVVTESWEASTAVTSGEVRIVSGVRMKSKSARTTGGTLDDAELSNWQLEAVTTSNKASLKWDQSMVLVPGILMDLEGKVYESNGTEIANNAFTVTKDLPSSDISVIKGLGYRFYLNGIDVTADVSANATPTRMVFSTFHVDKGDEITILPPVV